MKEIVDVAGIVLLAIATVGTIAVIAALIITIIQDKLRR